MLWSVFRENPPLSLAGLILPTPFILFSPRKCETRLLPFKETGATESLIRVLRESFPTGLLSGSETVWVDSASVAAVTSTQCFFLKPKTPAPTATSLEERITAREPNSFRIKLSASAVSSALNFLICMVKPHCGNGFYIYTVDYFIIRQHN